MMQGRKLGVSGDGGWTLPSAAGCAVTKHHHHRTRTNDPAVATLSARAPLLSLHPPPTRPLTHSHTPALRWASCCTQPAPPAPFLFSSLLHPPHHLPPSPPPYRRSLDFLVASVERPADESLLAKKKESLCVLRSTGIFLEDHLSSVLFCPFGCQEVSSTSRQRHRSSSPLPTAIPAVVTPFPLPPKQDEAILASSLGRTNSGRLKEFAAHVASSLQGRRQFVRSFPRNVYASAPSTPRHDPSSHPPRCQSTASLLLTDSENRHCIDFRLVFIFLRIYDPPT
ncbi:hypothetical protein EX30DRAFT_386960 [Ascodesmis nigricans]|uniref:Uncharacterized protein n=1 Tax=Ascodesmis nigricans TaxID=341454 RepID=A0A4S2N0V4_9PEZI|nr:hypothetical protein EX30DRAFT_386960 [Ascodesmis nigricans]